ncbi:odorant receptor 131-2-like [Nelusetta ayraudi]|uniref:odorant receptor 131-2-like n=1 Tax=Nelusetta ayraudi TaxID=303726 RepID=UPI003F722619
MVGNTSANASVRTQINWEVIFVQILVFAFLCINTMMILTFFTRAYFYTKMRYILFATSLLSDCLMLIVTNVLLILSYSRTAMPLSLCLAFFVVSSVNSFVTPVTLTAMTLERYVAICMPLRHAQLCSKLRALWCIFIIHGISSVPCVLILLSFFAPATQNLLRKFQICAVHQFTSQTWQIDLRLGISQTYFLIMCLVIMFCYAKIMKVAKAASGDNKKSSRKGLRTVILHGVQLLLCLTQMWCPFIEAAVLKISLVAFNTVRFSNYILFYLVPRCLSPLIYGLRDDKFVLALKYYALCDFRRNKSLDLTR